WPPRPLLVTGSFVPGADTVTTAQHLSDPAAPPPGTTPVTEADDIRAQGANVFRTATPACIACHSTAPGANMAGPTMAGIVSRATEVLRSGNYKGEATDVEGYIRESIVKPSAHLVEGAMYSANGTSFMPNGYDK